MSVLRFSIHCFFFFLFVVACQNEQGNSNSTPTPPQVSEETPNEKVVSKNDPESPNSKAESPKKGFGLYVEDQVAEVGGTICLNVTAHDFKEIVSMQYTMNWNPNVLRFKEFASFYLKDLSATNFNTKTASKGSIPLSWFDQDIKGITLNNGTSVYDICFDVIGKSGDTSRFIITNDPVTIEISNAGGQLLDLNSRRAKVVVQ